MFLKELCITLEKCIGRRSTRASNGPLRESGCWGRVIDIVSSFYSAPLQGLPIIMSCFFCCYLCVPKATVTKMLDLDLNLGSLAPEPA